MTICPIAIAVGCKKCPAFKFCPLTTVLGDQQEEDEIEWSAGSTNTPNTPEKNNKEMESFKGEDAEVIPEKKKPLTKDERLALIKESAEKKPAYDQKVISDVNYESAKKNKLERDLKTWKSLDTHNE